VIQRISDDMLWSQIVARAWCDEGFKERLLADPRAVLAENNLVVPEGTEVEVAEGPEVQVVGDAHEVRRFIMPANPPDDLTDEDLGGGAVAYCWCGVCGGCGRCGCRCRC
jgi:hypothetical protein